MSSPYAQRLTQSVLAIPIHQALNLNLISQSPSHGSSKPTALIFFISAPIHLTKANTVHGGILSLTIDAACLIALVPTLSDGQTAATIASSFQILDAIPGEGNVYEIEGRVTRRGKRVAFCEGEVRCGGRVIAKGSVTKTIFEARKDEAKL